jgi:NAD(P)-dependent dehydrogenase (short-subunit alcohol dehydrogenase family)
MMKLKDKIAIVTGAGRGIGRATALALAQEGAHLVLAARTVSEIEVVAEEIRSVGREVLVVATDVAKKADVVAMVQQTLERFGKVDILVNNAGVAVHNPIPDIREEDWDLNINVNLKSVFLCTQAVFTRMCAQGSGHIVNVSSLAGKYYPYKMAAYGAAKWGVVGLTGITQEEGRPHGVRAILVRPGPVDTKMRRDNHDDDLDKLPQPEDIAEAILLAVTQHPRAYTPVFDVYPFEDPGGDEKVPVKK